MCFWRTPVSKLRRWLAVGILATCLVVAWALLSKPTEAVGAPTGPELSSEKGAIAPSDPKQIPSKEARGAFFGKLPNRLWPTGDGGERKVKLSASHQTVTIVTREPGAVRANAIREIYSVPFDPLFAKGAWNDFVVAGWARNESGDQFILERWRLKHVEGAYEGDLPPEPEPQIGVPKKPNWPSGGWVGDFVEPRLRAEREPPVRTELLRGGLGSVDSYLVDGHMRFILLGSREHASIYRVRLSGKLGMEVFLSAEDIPWLASKDFDPQIRAIFTQDGIAHYGVYARRRSEDHPTTGSLHAFIADDTDNDGVIDNIFSVAKGRKGWARAYPLGQTVAPHSIHR